MPPILFDLGRAASLPRSYPVRITVLPPLKTAIPGLEVQPRPRGGGEREEEVAATPLSRLPRPLRVAPEEASPTPRSLIPTAGTSSRGAVWAVGGRRWRGETSLQEGGRRRRWRGRAAGAGRRRRRQRVSEQRAAWAAAGPCLRRLRRAAAGGRSSTAWHRGEQRRRGW